jgi:hypothetical protein
MEMRELLIALTVVLVLLFIETTCVEVANGKETEKRGPTYILEKIPKSKHILRIRCSWGGGKLTCGPAIGTKWFKEWEWK